MKTIEEINNKIKQGKAIVLTAAEVKQLTSSTSPKEIARKVDVVTTATFSPMCSTGVFLNLGHTTPRLKMQRVLLDNVPAYGGIAAVDVFLGAAENSTTNPLKGGAHVICKLIKGEEVAVEAYGEPTDCYPGSSVKGKITLDTINQAYFFNPRNCYQNYNAAVNSSNKKLKTYMGILNPAYGNVAYAGAGEISPLMNDPDLRTIGIGTPIFFCGGTGYIAWEGTQYNKNQARDERTHIPTGPAATLAIIADMRMVKPDFIKPVVVPGYGISIAVSIGVAIPVLDEDMAMRVSVQNKNIKTSIIDYATGERVTSVNYRDLLGGQATINGKAIRTTTMSRNRVAQDITVIMKNWIMANRFSLNAPVKSLPVHGTLKSFPGD